jgi:phosphatidylserine decarboxylase
MCTCRSITKIPGQLYTVNPIAVNSPLCDVFTDNKRFRVAIKSPAFGMVQFIIVGATMVGSINLSVEVGDSVAKGDELGYFAFGGSTCIALLQADMIAIDSDIARMSSRCASAALRTYLHLERFFWCL